MIIVLLMVAQKTKHEYDKLNPYQKQDWLIRQIGGSPNERKSGDEGVDGELTIHLGFDKDKKDLWGKMVISVKTGKQCNPAMIRELIGTMKDKKAVIGGLILDIDPSQKMEEKSQEQGQIEYQYHKKISSSFYDKVQILTAQEIIDKNTFHTPPTLKEIKLYRDDKQLDMIRGIS